MAFEGMLWRNLELRVWHRGAVSPDCIRPLGAVVDIPLLKFFFLFPLCDGWRRLDW